MAESWSLEEFQEFLFCEGAELSHDEFEVCLAEGASHVDPDVWACDGASQDEPSAGAAKGASHVDPDVWACDGASHVELLDACAGELDGASHETVVWGFDSASHFVLLGACTGALVGAFQPPVPDFDTLEFALTSGMLQDLASPELTGVASHPVNSPGSGALSTV